MDISTPVSAAVTDEPADPLGVIAARWPAAPCPPATPYPPAAPAGRIDVAAVVVRLRHIEAAPEPALVFSQLAEVSVPSVCDEVVIDLVENDHVYRIRRPAGGSELPRPVRGQHDPLIGSDDGPIVGRNLIIAPIRSPESALNGSSFSGTVMCRWRDGYSPVAADASLIGLMIDHAVALVDRERLARMSVGRQFLAGQIKNQLTDNGRIASAVGVVMALHHVDQSKAMDLLVRISGRTGRGLADLAESVVQSGVLPPVPPPTEEDTQRDAGIVQSPNG